MSGFGVDRGSGASAGVAESDSGLTDLMDAKGDLIAGTGAGTAAVLTAGTNEMRLVADSAQVAGLKYVADTTNYAVAAKGDILAGTAADTVAPRTVGTDGKRLVADSGQATGLNYVEDTTNYAIAAKGDLLVGTAADTVAPLTVGANGTIPMARSAAAAGMAYVAALKNRIYGLDCSNSAVDATNDIVVAVGGCMSSDGAEWMELAAALTKRIDASWAVGDTQGGLDGTESSAGTPDNDTWYYVYLIKRSDTGVVDVLFSESSSSPTMPTNYDARRLIGAVRRGTATNLKFYQDGDWVRWQGSVSVLSGGTATSETAITTSAAAPSISKALDVFVYVTGVSDGSSNWDMTGTLRVATGVTWWTHNWTSNGTASGVAARQSGPALQVPYTGLLSYLIVSTAGTSNQFNVSVFGFKLAR